MSARVVKVSPMPRRTPTGYILCATPRTGSTLLCSLLTSTNVLGSPESYFRVEDEETWAGQLGVPVVGGRVRDYGAFALAVHAAGSTANGVFAARAMWGSVERIIDGLAPPASQPDVEALEGAFGPLAFIHLTRGDVVAQGVSWARAEQTGYWHHGDTAFAQPKPDLARMAHLVEEIDDHNALWERWFTANHVQPHRLTYEALTRDPAGTIAGIASHLGVVVPEVWRPAPPHRKQADRTSAEWSMLLRASLNRKVE